MKKNYSIIKKFWRSILDIFIVRKLFYINLKQEILLEKYENLSIFCNDIGVCNDEICDKNVTISLTSYGKRVHQAYITLETIMQQTVKPNRIVLWLAEDEFSTQTLPLSLQRLIPRGLEIRFCKNIKSYKKLIPSLQAYPNDILITIDDDVFYPLDFLEYMLNSYKKDPQKIYFYRGHRIKLTKNNSISNYKTWTFGIEDTICDIKNFPVGCGGVLYPPNSLHSEVFNEKAFMSICPNADDVWFKAMSILNKTLSQKVEYYAHYNQRFLTNTYLQDNALFKENYLKNGNDVQLKRVFKEYNINI